MWTAIETVYPNTVESIRCTSIGPYFFERVMPFDPFKKHFRGIKDVNRLHEEYGDDVNFLVIENHKINRKEGSIRTYQFLSDNESLDLYLNNNYTSTGEGEYVIDISKIESGV